MSGTKQFDESTVLDAVIGLFKDNGYAGTSVASIESATQLNKSSIYNAYENKEGLYTAALERFRKEYTSQALAMLDNADFPAAIYSFCKCLTDGFESGGKPNGCFATLAALEVGAGDDAAGESIQAGLNEMLIRLEQRCQQAIEDDQLSPNWDPSELAAMIIAVSRGAIVLNKGTGNCRAGLNAYKCLLSQLDIQFP